MENQNKKFGWIKLYRSIMNHWIWDVREAFCKRAAFVDLLMLVNKEDKEIEFDNKLITGQKRRKNNLFKISF